MPASPLVRRCGGRVPSNGSWRTRTAWMTLSMKLRRAATPWTRFCRSSRRSSPKSTPRSQQRLSSRLAVGVAGRKWAQAEAFADVLSAGHGPVVDWCSGKGHLARVLCHRGCCSSAHCLELDEALCASGAALSTDLPIDFTVTDALGADPLPPRLRGSAYAHTALHACGDLHRRALVTACRERARHIALVPCCYHKVGPEAFSPLSRRVAAESALLPLRTAELQLATAQTATASTAARARAAVAAGDRRVAAGGARRGRVSQRAVGAGAAAAQRRRLR